MAKIQLWGYRCERCGHEWLPRKQPDGTDAKDAPEPRICPKCKSAYWNVPRKGKPLPSPSQVAGGKSD